MSQMGKINSDQLRLRQDTLLVYDLDTLISSSLGKLCNTGLYGSITRNYVQYMFDHSFQIRSYISSARLPQVRAVYK